MDVFCPMCAIRTRLSAKQAISDCKMAAGDPEGLAESMVF